MKSTPVEWLLLVILIGASSGVALWGNQDASLLVAAYAMCSFAIVSNRALLPINRNIVLFLAVSLFLVLLAYRSMFDLAEVQLYVAGDLAVRKSVVSYGAWLIQLLIVGGYIGVRAAQGGSFDDRLPNFRQPAFRYLLVIGWLPLLANLFLYFVFFRGRAYVDIHTMGNGPVGLVLKTIYLTYGAIILMSIGAYSADRGFRAIRLLLVGFLVVYGALLNLRSPLLSALLLLAYFYGQRVSTQKLILFLTLSVLAFSAIGIVRDPSTVEGGIGFGFIKSVLGLGEFADALRFAMERSEWSSPLWGGGIAGSFLGITEPIANDYAKAISPEYFDEGGGFGFFILADLVVNFGTIGASVIIVITGVILARLYYSSRRVGSYVFLPILFANLFGVVRNDLGSTFRGIVYTMLSVALIWISWKLIRPTAAKRDRKGDGSGFVLPGFIEKR